MARADTEPVALPRQNALLTPRGSPPPALAASLHPGIGKITLHGAQFGRIELHRGKPRGSQHGGECSRPPQPASRLWHGCRTSQSVIGKRGRGTGKPDCCKTLHQAVLRGFRVRWLPPQLSFHFKKGCWVSTVGAGPSQQRAEMLVKVAEVAVFLTPAWHSTKHPHTRTRLPTESVITTLDMVPADTAQGQSSLARGHKYSPPRQVPRGHLSILPALSWLWKGRTGCESAVFETNSSAAPQAASSPWFQGHHYSQHGNPFMLFPARCATLPASSPPQLRSAAASGASSAFLLLPPHQRPRTHLVCSTRMGSVSHHRISPPVSSGRGLP